LSNQANSITFFKLKKRVILNWLPFCCLKHHPLQLRLLPLGRKPTQVKWSRSKLWRQSIRFQISHSLLKISLHSFNNFHESSRLYWH